MGCLIDYLVFECYDIIYKVFKSVIELVSNVVEVCDVNIRV